MRIVSTGHGNRDTFVSHWTRFSGKSSDYKELKFVDYTESISSHIFQFVLPSFTHRMNYVATLRCDCENRAIDSFKRGK